MSDSVAIVSGGLDSTTLVYYLLNQGSNPHLLSFNYGQRHKKELEYAARTAKKLGLKHDIVDLSVLTGLLAGSGSVLVSDNPVPDGHYAEDNMKQTVVPNRNMIMLAIAAGVAVAENAEFLAVGVHAGDHFIYPDCRPEFLNWLHQAIMSGNEGFVSKDFALRAPFLHKSKADIATWAVQLGVPFEETWSCYKGGDIHCGRCGTCVERLEAIDEARNRWVDKALDQDAYYVFDHTEYADTKYWREAVANA